jgi:D-alanine-D-alanine ligase
MSNLSDQARELLSGKHLVVLMGGPGREREVSLRSGAAVARALRAEKFRVSELDVRDASFELPSDTALVFNMVHGTFGEDGQLQAELDRRGIPYTGEGAEGSRLAFDKIATKRLFKAKGVPTVSYETLHSPSQPVTFKPPFVVKAPRQGSSVGVHIVRSEESLSAALADCFSLDSEVLVESFFAGKELTVGILGGEALPVVEIVPIGGFYDYEHKYTKGSSDYFVPARISEEETAVVQAAALSANRALNLSVYCRVDVMLAPTGEVNVLEINTIPGMTETSLLPKAAAASGRSFADLCLEIAAISLKRFDGGLA